MTPTIAGPYVVYRRRGNSLRLGGVFAARSDLPAPILVAPDVNSDGDLAVINGRLLFRWGVGADAGLWSWDTGDGSLSALCSPGSEAWATHRVTSAASIAYVFRESPSGRSLWATDGTPLGTTKLLDCQGELGGRAVSGDRMYFVKYHTYGTSYSEIWTSDGTPSGTRPIAGLPMTVAQLWAAPGNSGVYCAGKQLWHVGPEPEGNRFIMSFPSGTTFVPFGSARGFSVFATVEGGGWGSPVRGTPWISGGTTESTFGLPGILDGDAMMWAQAGESFFFRDSGWSGEPWRIDLQTGAVQLFDPPAAYGFGAGAMFPLDGGRGVGVVQLALIWTGNVALSVGLNDITFYAADGIRRNRANTSWVLSTPVSIGSKVYYCGRTADSGFEPRVLEQCAGDYDMSGVLTTADIFTYLSDWMAGERDAVFNPGVTVPGPGDMMQFLQAWLSGCG